MNLRGECGVNPGEIDKERRSGSDHKALFLCIKLSKNKYVFMFFSKINVCVSACVKLLIN